MNWLGFVLVCIPLACAFLGQALLDVLHPMQPAKKEEEGKQKRKHAVDTMADTMVNFGPAPTSHVAKVTTADKVERQRRRRLEEEAAHGFSGDEDFAMPADFDMAAMRNL